MKVLFKTAGLIVLLVFLSGVLSACSARSVKETIRGHKIIVTPAQRMAPRPVQTIDGQTIKPEGFEIEGETMMIVIRGRI